MTEYCITFEDVQAAAKRISGTAHKTPVLSSQGLNDLAGRSLVFKVEALQKTGSFKFRGAFNAVQSILEENRNVNELSVVTHSSGNHAQALAKAAQLSSTATTTVHATIVMPSNTPIVKKKAVLAFGGEVVLVANTNEAREMEAERIQRERHAHFVHPSEDPRVIAGQGTVCLELIEQCQPEVPDVVIIPVGGGGLASGNTIALRALLGRTVQIVLAEPQVLDDAKRSFEAKQLLKHAPDNTLDSVADGLKTTLGTNTWPIVRDMVDEIFTVSEREILAATKLVWERLKIGIEPSAGVGMAVALSSVFSAKYPATKFPKVAIVLCGGNVDFIRTAAKMSELGL